MKQNYPRTFINCDNYQFEVNTCALFSEKEFKKKFENLENFNWKNAYFQIKQKDIELSKINIEKIA